MIVKIHGGIGNQLYQYAFLASFKINHIRAKVNLDFYKNDMLFPRESLLIYNYLNFPVVRIQIKPNFISMLSKKYNQFRFMYLLNLYFGNVITEKIDYGFKSVFLSRGAKNILLQGYFSDYRYIRDGLSDVREAYKNLINEYNLSYQNVVALHIRRGDYSRIIRTDGKSNVLDKSYYLNCLGKLKIGEFCLRIYTDDYVWAKRELSSIFTGIELDFEPEKFNDIDSLWTMSKHQYLIGANSTFSLWAYYFGMNEMTMFYFPKEWSSSIEKKGFQLFSRLHSNYQLVNEE